MSEHNQQKQTQQQQTQKQGGSFWSSNFLLRAIRTGWNYYMTLIQEALLAAIFVSPIYFYFRAAKIEEITIPTDFLSLMAIALAMFLLQNSMWRRK